MDSISSPPSGSLGVPRGSTSPQSRPSSAASVPLTALDATLALLVTVAAVVLYASTSQTWFYGDGAQLVAEYGSSPPGTARWMHFLYFPAADLLRRLLPDLDPGAVLSALSVTSSALAVGVVFLLGRAVGGSRAVAAVTAALLAASPVCWFYATIVEVYPPHLLAVSTLLFVLALPALRASRSRWRAPLALGLFWPLLYGTHLTAVLLAPGLLLAAYALPRPGVRRVDLREFARDCVLPLALAHLVAVALAAGLRGGSSLANPADALGFLEQFQRKLRLDFVWREWFAPLGLFGVGIFALARPSLPAVLRAAVLCAVFLPLAFFTLFGVGERGGYALSGTPFFVLAIAGGAGWGAVQPGARRTRRALGWLVGLTLVALQLGLGWSTTAPIHTAFDTHFAERLERRATAVAEALPEGGFLLSFEPSLQTVQARVPNVRELHLAPVVAGCLERGETPEAFRDDLLQRIDQVLAHFGEELVLDLESIEQLAEVPGLAPYLEAFERGVNDRYRVTESSPAGWKLARVEARGD